MGNNKQNRNNKNSEEGNFSLTYLMKIFVTGTRGIPDIPGGVETHCQGLYPLIVQHGHEVILSCRKPYVTYKKKQFQGVLLLPIFAPHTKNLEALVHTFLSIIKARWMNADLLHIHAVGPGLMVPFARLLGLPVVFTDHGPDYNRQKWNRAQKAILIFGEYLGCRFSNETIVISKEIGNILKRRHKRNSHLIYNAVPKAERSSRIDFLEHLGVTPNNYLLTVARFVPEKGLHDLLEAFKGIDSDCQLVIAGDADHETEYSRMLKKQALLDDRIILLGYVGGEKLCQIFSHARLFILPSYHEGLPIALLEAMSYEIPALVSDIPANKELGLYPKRYFSCGDIHELQIKIKQLVNEGLPNNERQAYRLMLQEKFNWPTIADQTLLVYNKVFSTQ